MSSPDSSASQHEVLEFCEKLVALLLDSQGRIKEKLVFFIGAGCSREYGIPTTSDLAKKFLMSDRGGLSKDERAAISGKSPEEIFALFLDKFRSSNTITIEYAFFQDLVTECRRDFRAKASTYDMLADLWIHDYIDFVITTNFDELIEECVEQDVTVLDYRDIRDRNFPEAQDALVLIKIAGDIRRSSMLWSPDDFTRCINDAVAQWLTTRSAQKPLVIMGYRAAEKEIAQVLLQHEREMFIVLPGDLSQSANMISIVRLKKGRPAYHIDSTASQFLEIITEKIYEKSHDTRLSHSFYALRDKIESLNERYTDMPDSRLFVARHAVHDTVKQFIQTTQEEDRVLVLLGDSGYGKSHYLKHLAQTWDREAAVIYIAASEVPQGIFNSWFDRLGEMTIDKLCNLCVARRRNLLLIIDGLNEVDDASTALGLLAEITAALDKYTEVAMKFIIASRPEFWHNLTDKLHRRDYANTLVVDRYTSEECAQGLDKLGFHFTVEAIERHPARELLAIPIYQSLLSHFPVKKLENITSERLFGRLFERYIAKRKPTYRTVHRLCLRMAEEQSIAIRNFPDDLRSEDQQAFRELADLNILQENRLGKTSFRYDTFGEYTFGRAYLYEDLYSDYRSPGDEPRVIRFMRNLLTEWRSIPTSQLGFKIFFLNALRYFALCLEPPDVEILLRCREPSIEQITKDAIYLRKDVRFSPAFREDPFLLCISLLRRSNYPDILAELEREDGRLVSIFPLNVAAKLFPENLLAFVEFVLYRTIKRLPLNPYPRTSLNIICNGILIYMMRNGPPPREGHRKLWLLLAGLRKLLDNNFLASKLEETLLDNSRYLLYSENAARLADITEAPSVYKDRLMEAVDTTVFGIDETMLIELIRHSMVLRMVVMFLLLRDREDERIEEILHTLLQSRELRLQDFALTVYGHLSKLDESYAETLRESTLHMRNHSPSNFYQLDIDGSDPDSQYDPLVPYVSTQLFNRSSTEIELPSWETSPEDLSGLSRLFYKLAVDFPEVTLRTIYKLKLRGVDIYEHFGSTMKTVQRFHPEAFWNVTRTFAIDDCFRPEFDQIQYEPKSVRQVRDWDWFRIFKFVLSSDERKDLAEKIIREALTANSFHSLMISMLRTLGPSLAQK